MPTIRFTLNGKPTEATYESGMHLLEVLRESCGVVSAKNGCAPEGACGCCLVMIDGRPALSCLRKPEQMDGHEIVTLEGLPEETRRIIGEAFVLEGGVQCGFCIPGIVVRAASLIDHGKSDDPGAIRKALDGHLCRCTGYGRIIDAIQTAGEAVKNGGQLPTQPRRHDFFGERFGLQRNTAFVRTDRGPSLSGIEGHRIGDSPARQGGLEQTLGEKPFVDDMHAPGMLHGAMVLTEHPRARVMRIDTSVAAQMPGVVRIFTATDVSGSRGTGLTDPDTPVFVAEGEVTCCVSDFIAMVVADTQFHARAAAKKVKVDYDVREPITDPFEALKPESPLVHSVDTFSPRPSNLLQPITAFKRGNVDEAMKGAVHVIEGTWRTQPIEIAFLEPEACLVIPQGGGVAVHTDSQGSVYDQQQIAKVLNIDPKDVEIHLAASGGAFGAKEELSIQAQTALAAHLLGRPVKTVLTREQSTQHHVKRHAMTVTLTVGADAEGRLLAVRSRIVADAGGYHTTSAKCALRAACHTCGPYRVPNVDVESKAVYTNNPNGGAMRGFGSNQAQFAMEGVMDILAEKVGVDGWDIRYLNALDPGDQFATGQVMRESVRGMKASLDAVKNVYKTAKYKGIGCGIKSTGLGNGTVEGGYIKIRVLEGPRLEILNGYTEMGQGVFTATMQSVCEETGLPAELMTVQWDKELGNKCGETWASRGTTLSCAAARDAAKKLAADLEQVRHVGRGSTPRQGQAGREGPPYESENGLAGVRSVRLQPDREALQELVGREYDGEYVLAFTTRPGTPEAVLNPTTHLTFSYATQVVILNEDGVIERVVAAHDVGRAINPRLCAEQMEGGVHMGLGYALSEDFPSTNGVPHSLALRDLGIVAAKHMPAVDVILIEVPDEIGGYGAKGVGEIGCVATAPAVAAALHAYDGIRRFRLPMDDAPAARPSVPKSRRKSV
jgi:CO/xanthine dehydrogenase Mo-binding subunit/aerobic-type carbon monoxide dehydrogenase small subunit (CoxS/CutS family)